MIEHDSSPNIEAEIAELSRQIESKRLELEQKNNIVTDDKALVRDIITSANSATTTSAKIVSDSNNNSDSYLDSLPVGVEKQVGQLVEKVFDRGLTKTIAEAKKLPALDLDAFHDTLTDRVYNELKSRGLVS
ncbi:MAG: hypothetical protein AAB821_00080 [Patescibacteria group bacterium]